MTRYTPSKLAADIMVVVALVGICTALYLYSLP